MRIVLIQFVLIVFFASSIKAQKYSREISPDSLLKMFQSDPPFDVLQKFRASDFKDYKGAYYNKELKPYLLKWLDKEEYWNYSVEQGVQNFTNNPEAIKNAIKYKLTKKTHASWLDSIYNSPTLLQKYRDSVIAEKIDIYKTALKKQTSYPPYDAIWFHSQVAYPESYSIIKQWWIDQGKPVLTKNNTPFNTYFLALVKMRDPEAIQLADKEVKKFVQSNGKSATPIEFMSFIGQNQTPFGIAMLLETLSVNVKFPYFPDYPMEQFNCMAIGMLEEQLYLNSIPINAPIKRTSTCEERLKHVKAFKDAAQLLIKKYQEEEKYWMDNMPYKKK